MNSPSRARPQGTWLGFDYGLKRIGVAVGQTLTAQANPLKIVACDQGKPDWSAIEALIQEWRPVALVVGLPRHADGTDNDLTPRVRRFARQLHGRFERPIYGLDEALSSQAAREMATIMGDRRPAGAAIDDWAAVCILQDALGGGGELIGKDET
ncbi:putative Holliday junction resolvase [Natronospira proteinivora]|uniref:Putative pre-16S rRNA nuclease n=1 Tax=Natronospira proteinivora TaxID=1807133 RepID=A0ABT1GAQ4_9GAMM|nr:Holliday junction resolvase RuvX [Natronospira proteinivora]MCP1728400.1 putative Holliday junction resolvase [Natronospira proteinivora]